MSNRLQSNWSNSLAENNTKRAKVEEITSWYQYRKHFEKRLDDILPENQINDKRAYDLASGQIYDEMLQYLSGISRVSLRKRTQRTKPIYKLFSVIGEDKIKRIKTYSANKLSKLTDVQIDTIKKHLKGHCSAIDSQEIIKMNQWLETLLPQNYQIPK